MWALSVMAGSGTGAGEVFGVGPVFRFNSLDVVDFVPWVYLQVSPAVGEPVNPLA